MALSLSVSGFVCYAETPAETIQKQLVTKGVLNELDIETLKTSGRLAKLLPTDDKREVSVIGIIAINAPPDLGLKTLQEASARQNKKSIMDRGDFSAEPVLADIQALTLEPVDIEDLKKCKVWNCRIKLSAEMIERFQKEVDWSAPNHVEQANLLFRAILFEYIQDYLARGNQALIECSNDPKPIRLRDEYASLSEDLPLIKEVAPEFAEYLKAFPKSELPNLRKSINWNKLKFGLNPVIVVTQTVTYTKEEDGTQMIFSVSKQIFATRYFDSTLGMTALIKTSSANTAPESYLVYANRSRSSSLGGMMSGFKRAIVEREALEKLKPLLEEAKEYAEAEVKKEVSPSPSDTDDPPTAAWDAYSIAKWGVIFAVIAIVLAWLVKRMTKS